MSIMNGPHFLRTEFTTTHSTKASLDYSAEVDSCRHKNNSHSQCAHRDPGEQVEPVLLDPCQAEEASPNIRDGCGKLLVQRVRVIALRLVDRQHVRVQGLHLRPELRHLLVMVQQLLLHFLVKAVYARILVPEPPWVQGLDRAPRC